MTSRIDLKRAFLAALTAVTVAFALVLVYGAPARADGNGSPTECMTEFEASGDKDEQSFTADPGKIVDGVCIKSGSLHTGALGNGLHVDECYEVSGVGTQTVVVKRVGDPGRECQEISHVDVLVIDEPPAESGKIIVKKEVTEGSATDQSFVFTTDYSSDFSLKDGESNDSGDLVAGSYTVSETVPDGWQLKSETCSDGSDPSSISLQEGETVTCTFENHEIPDEVSPTSIVSTTTTIVSTTVEVSVETLPFTGFENGTTGLLALLLVGSGALALVGTRVFREETDE
ncbi:MAG: hypothetical protein IH818_05040 [Acidobacteria bacterium]|nr:hypothetical protein [Acidobacteriota bacterium]